jgi:hypothetical protein
MLMENDLFDDYDIVRGFRELDAMMAIRVIESVMMLKISSDLFLMIVRMKMAVGLSLSLAQLIKNLVAGQDQEENWYEISDRVVYISLISYQNHSMDIEELMMDLDM